MQGFSGDVKKPEHRNVAAAIRGVKKCENRHYLPIGGFPETRHFVIDPAQLSDIITVMQQMAEIGLIIITPGHPW
jgi:hypothetical protein